MVAAGAMVTPGSFRDAAALRLGEKPEPHDAREKIAAFRCHVRLLAAQRVPTLNRRALPDGICAACRRRPACAAWLLPALPLRITLPWPTRQSECFAMPSSVSGGIGSEWRARLSASGADALYLHIPFCARKCAYCDFASWTTARGDALSRRSAEALERQVEEVSCPCSSHRARLPHRRGGTPRSGEAWRARPLRYEMRAEGL